MAKSATKRSENKETQPSRIENGKALLIAGLTSHYTSPTMSDIPAQWQRFVSYLDQIRGRVGRITYGVCWNAFAAENGIDYLSGVEVSSLSGLPSEFGHASLPAQRYAVFQHAGHVSQVGQTCAQIERWARGSGRELVPEAAASPSFFERYGEGFDPRTGLRDIEIWVPIKP